MSALARRAMTLVEVLAATMLLAVVAAVAAGFLGDATRRPVDHDPEATLTALAAVADAALRDPALPSWLPAPSADALLARTLPDGSPVVATLIADPADDHGWLVLRARGVAVSRWLPLDRPRGRRP